MAKKQKQKELIKLEDTDILKPIDISQIGSNGDPCFTIFQLRDARCVGIQNYVA